MRPLPLLAASLVLATLPSAVAGSSSVLLTGPDRLDAATPTSTDLGIALLLDGVICVGEADIPVRLQIIEMRGLHSASLSWDQVLFRIAGQQAATQPWRGDAEVALRVRGADPVGRVVVEASYALPPHCIVAGTSQGSATHAVAIDGPPAPAEPSTPGEPTSTPLVAPKSESILAPPPEPQESAIERPRPPAHVVGAILGMIAGGAIVLRKRLRLWDVAR